MALAVVNTVREQIINDCSDEEITQQMARIHPDLRGTYKEEDFMNYDEALKALGFGYNRNRLNALAKQHNIKNYTFKNNHIGFKKEDIAMLKRILAQQNKK
jgi:hypothetical protein